jgi:hypothetical protein
VGAVLRWEYSTNGGSSWVTVNSTAASLTYSNIPATRLYRAVVQNGICALAYSSGAVVSVIPPFPSIPGYCQSRKYLPGRIISLKCQQRVPGQWHQ